MKVLSLSFQRQNQTSFQGVDLNKRAVQELETVVKPFLSEYYRPQYSNLLAQLDTKLKQFKSVNSHIQPNYKPAEFKEVKRLKLGDLGANLDEFEYLEKKADKWFAGENAVSLGKEIRKSGLFEVPDFLEGAFGFYKKLKLDIKNGLKNMTYEKLAPAQYAKEQKLYNTTSNLFMSSNWYIDVDFYGKRIQKNLENHTLTENIYTNAKENITRAIKTHKKLLPDIKEATDTAEAINKEIFVTPEDEAVLKQLHKPAQRVISRNVSRFNKEVQNIRLSNEQEIFLNELLEKQKTAIEKLWNTIEEGKKVTFAPKKQSFYSNIPVDDDIPF